MAKPRESYEIKAMKKSPLAKILLEKSLLDEKTLQILLLYYSGEGQSFEEIARKTGMGRSGVWKRWKRGKEILMRSFYTLELALYLGLVEEEIARLVVEDLSDYLAMKKGEKTLQETRENLQRRMLLTLRRNGKSI